MLIPSIPAHLQQGTDPIDKSGLLAALTFKVLTSEELIAQVRQRGVSFKMKPADENEIRRQGAYLGKNGLDNLIVAVHDNYRVKTTPTPVSSPRPSISEPLSAVWSGTELVGISGTGVTARVSAVGTMNFSSPTTTIILEVKNTSKSGTITSIGSFVKVVRKPTEGSKLTVPGEVTPPGYYKFTNEDVIVETPTFKAICPFAFLTTGSRAFHTGNINAGIPPGESTRFSIAGDMFLGDFNPRQLEKGIMIRFQGIGINDDNDIALYPNANVLFSASDPIYQISKTTPK